MRLKRTRSPWRVANEPRALLLLFDPACDSSPDTLIVDQNEAVVVAVVSADLCFACREAEDRPLTHLLKHAEVDE